MKPAKIPTLRIVAMPRYWMFVPAIYLGVGMLLGFGISEFYGARAMLKKCYPVDSKPAKPTQERFKQT